MTATGPDMGTEEFEKAYRGRIDRHIKTRYRLFNTLNAIADNSPFALLDFDIKEELQEAFALPKTPRARILFSVVHFAEFTGGFPKDKADRVKLYQLLRPSLETPEYMPNLAGHVGRFMELARFRNIAEQNHKGNITPELAAILNDSYNTDELPEEYRKELPEYSFLLAAMIDDNKLDFEPFRGEKDTGADWYFNYRIETKTLPFTNYEITLEEITERAEREYISYLAQFKGLAKAVLAGTKVSDTAVKGTMLQAVKKSDDYIIPPTRPEVLLQLAEAAETQYQRRQKERTRKDYAAPFNGPAAAGFYINPVTCKVHDLRPYWKELHALFSVNSWRFIKDFVAAIREAVAEFTGEGPARKKEKPQPPSIFDKAFIKMFNATPTNELVNLNTSTSGRPDSENAILEQNMFTQEWEYKKGGTELNYPVKQEGENALLPLFTTSTWKTMHFISLLFTAQNSAKQSGHVFPVVETTVREYMAATGRKVTVNNVKDVTKTLKKDLETLNEIKIKYTDKKYSLDLIRPFPGVHLNRGQIRVTLEPAFAEYLAHKTGFLMNYPAALLKLKENNSNLYPLGYKLALNRSNDSNIKKGKANILSVAVCLESCRGIPSIEKVRKDKNSPAKRIIEPFERAMDALQQQGVLERWEYCLAKGEPLGQAAVTDYKYFISLYVLYEIKDFPIGEELPRIQATAEKRQKRKERIERLIDSNIAKSKAKAAMEQDGKKTE